MRSRTSSCTSATSFCFSSCIVVRPDLHSFPTRRSSDLLKRALELLLMPLAAAVVFVEDVLLHYLGLAMAALAKWPPRSEEHTSELQSRVDVVCRLLLEKKKTARSPALTTGPAAATEGQG